MMKLQHYNEQWDYDKTMPEATIKYFNSRDAGFERDFASLLVGGPENDAELRDRVGQIIARVRAEGDAALLDYSRQFDQRQASSVAELTYGREDFARSWEALDSELAQALEFACARIRAYHQHQVLNDWHYQPDLSVGQRIVPLARVGIYAPGGTACYPSSVLMNAVVARVAGVAEVVLVSPNVDANNHLLLAAAHCSGVDQLLSVGGAQAIAALAYGTESIAAVSKITGPGNKYVAEAKRQVFGKVGIDMVAGPSEVVIVADAEAPLELVIADMLAQAEHDVDARAILISTSGELLSTVRQRITEFYSDQPRRAIIEQALKRNSALIQSASLDEAIDLANRLAPEHLQLMVNEPRQYLDAITSAGAVFLGNNCAEVLGDYCAGSNHVLPTGGAGVYAQALGVYDFVKRVSYVDATSCSGEQLQTIAQHSARLAEAEALYAHQQAALLRQR